MVRFPLGSLEVYRDPKNGKSWRISSLLGCRPYSQTSKASA